ncbi:hypothetical protein CGGC5_v008473 [Colletotrichum fructicola Nara gc5]|uniref:YDG domain-containing protein n=1 Tax=Colletotrichum fructicola (strain Nara gc5) TaxID=1213859 RepID=A0A7J6J1T1_COLFN|nr:hypothetical protein CGGC5_v008473 [Colletotrichum fructicola Nara gc5]
MLGCRQVPETPHGKEHKHANKIVCALSSMESSVGIRYDGLYDVVGRETVPKNEAGTYSRFELHRHDGRGQFMYRNPYHAI